MTDWQNFLDLSVRQLAPSTPHDAQQNEPSSRLRAEYETVRTGCALVQRRDRALMELTGADRAAWLHNLTTQGVKTLAAGDGAYAFVLNVQGRILFDAGIIVRESAILLDLHRDFLDRALKHLNKYHIVESVDITDRSEASFRFALAGPRSAGLLAGLGAPHAGRMALWSSFLLDVRGTPVTVVRSDFCGLHAFDLLCEPAGAPDLFVALTDDSAGLHATPIGPDALEIVRIESAVPAPGREITDDVLPAETNRFAEAVSLNKGCYLGQEIVERMRSRGALARRLVGMECHSGDVPPPGSELLDSETVVGRITSACRSLALDRPIALAYLRSNLAEPGSMVTARGDNSSDQARVVSLPFVPCGSN